MQRYLPVLMGILFGLHAIASQAADPDDIIKYRKNVMNANGGLMGALNAILQSKVDDKAQLAGYAKALETLNRDIAGMFPKGTGTGDTDALPEVWNKRADFERRAKDARAKAVALASASGDPHAMESRFRELSETCKSCHKEFRK